MDDNYIKSLESALSASPENLPLLMLLVKGLLDAGSHEKAVQYLDDVPAERISQKEDQVLVAQTYLAAQKPDKALSFLSGDDPEILMAMARAHYDLGDGARAQACYQQAVEQNAALEDPKFAALVSARVVEPKAERTPRLRVISNDDTDDTELVRMLQPQEDVVTFADVGGLESVKHQIKRKIILPFQKPSLFKRFRKRVGGGILLYGPPGCGKTLLARATAGECNAQFYNVVISDILDMYIGESESKLHAVFDLARQNTPSVIFFDEVEALAAKRQHTREATSSKLVSQFLSELDGFSQDNSGVLILAATNVPWALDPAFRRPGRFDRIIFVAPPDKPARKSICDGLLEDRPGGERINTDRLAAKTSSYSGADLKNLIESAVDEAIEASITEEREVPLNMKHIDAALGDIRPTTIEWLTTARNYAKYSNESGQYNDVLTFLKKHGK